MTMKITPQEIYAAQFPGFYQTQMYTSQYKNNSCTFLKDVSKEMKIVNSLYLQFSPGTGFYRSQRKPVLWSLESHRATTNQLDSIPEFLDMFAGS